MPLDRKDRVQLWLSGTARSKDLHNKDLLHDAVFFAMNCTWPFETVTEKVADAASTPSSFHGMKPYHFLKKFIESVDAYTFNLFMWKHFKKKKLLHPLTYSLIMTTKWQEEEIDLGLLGDVVDYRWKLLKQIRKGRYKNMYNTPEESKNTEVPSKPDLDKTATFLLSEKAKHKWPGSMLDITNKIALGNLGLSAAEWVSHIISQSQWHPTAMQQRMNEAVLSQQNEMLNQFYMSYVAAFTTTQRGDLDYSQILRALSIKYVQHIWKELSQKDKLESRWIDLFMLAKCNYRPWDETYFDKHRLAYEKIRLIHEEKARNWMILGALRFETPLEARWIEFLKQTLKSEHSYKLIPAIREKFLVRKEMESAFIS